MKAVILAGGQGKRLKSIVDDRPKPMAEVASKPFLEYQIDYLKSHGISEVIFCVGYRHEQIVEYFKSGESWEIKIEYSFEDRPLGTAGALKNAERFLNTSFLVLNGDSYFELNLNGLIKFHDTMSSNKGYVGTIALTYVQDKSRYGAVITDKNSRIIKFEEKSKDTSTSAQINAGIYICKPEILSHIPAGQQVSIERETFPFILDKGLHLYAYTSDNYFVDIGTPEGYFKFQNYIKELHQ
jgi:NDP-sugar pyrophosphorylase family protein